jgi:hypothetical protein
MDVLCIYLSADDVFFYRDINKLGIEVFPFGIIECIRSIFDVASKVCLSAMLWFAFRLMHEKKLHEEAVRLSYI